MSNSTIRTHCLTAMVEIMAELTRQSIVAEAYHDDVMGEWVIVPKGF